MFRSDRDIVIGNIHEQAQRTLGQIRTNKSDEIDEWIIVGALADWQLGTKMVLVLTGLVIPAIMFGLAFLCGQWENQTLMGSLGLFTFVTCLIVLYRYGQIGHEYNRIRSELYAKEFTKIGERLCRANEYHRDNVEVYYPNESKYDLEYKDEEESQIHQMMGKYLWC